MVAFLPVLICFCLFFLVDVVRAYSTGAGTEACIDLIPMHPPNGPQPLFNVPYQISLDQTVAEPGTSVQVTVDAIPGNDRIVRGLVIQARAVNSTVPIGRFREANGFNFYNCQGGSLFGGLTHTEPSDKQLPRTFTWQAPISLTDGPLTGDVQFHATVVIEYSIYWANFVSPVLRIGTNNAPSFTDDCPPDQELDAEPQRPCVVVTYVRPICIDVEEGELPVICSVPTRQVYTPGSYFVTCTCTDSSSRTAVCSFSVRVNLLPSFFVPRCPGNIYRRIQGPATSVAVFWEEPEVFEAFQLSSTHRPGDSFPCGMTTVRYTYQNTNGRRVQCSFLVTVIRDVDQCSGPSVTSVSDVAVSTTDPEGAFVPFIEPTAVYDCGDGFVQSASHRPGDRFPIGNTEVTYTLSDICQNTLDYTFVVTVRQGVNSVPAFFIGCPITAVLGATDPGGSSAVVTFNVPTCSDAEDGFIAAVCTPNSGSDFPVGVTDITCTCTDRELVAISCSFEIQVQAVPGNTDPLFLMDCPDTVIVRTDGSFATNVAYTAPSCNDTQDGVLVSQCSPSSESFFLPGETTVICTCVDSGLLSVSCSFVVEVVANASPHQTIGICPSPFSVLAEVGDTFAVVTYDTPTCVDLAGVVESSAECTPSSGSKFGVGLTNVNCFCTEGVDVVGGSDRPDSCIFGVNVLIETPVCGSGPFTPRIVGGQSSALGRWPWQGSLGRNQQQTCGATLISAEWAITAARCFGSSATEVFFGDVTQSPADSTRQVSDVTWFPHPRYNSVTSEYDIALLQLHTPVTFNNFVSPACVYSSVNAHAANDFNPPELSELLDCYITGWGTLSDIAQTFPNTLQEASVNIFPPSSCFRYGEDFDPRIMICAGDQSSQSDTCQGDSGGPLICRDADTDLWNLAGVVSFGRGCALPGFPRVYTRISTTNSFVDTTRRDADTMILECATDGSPLLSTQRCDNIVDCPDFSDELGCPTVALGPLVELASPKYNLLTNFINRRWVYFPTSGRRLTLRFTLNNLTPLHGNLTTLTSLTGVVPQHVPARDPLTQIPFVVVGNFGQPIVISMDKTSVGSVAGFQATITDGV